MSNDVNDFLFSSGSKAFPFDEVGAICHGTVVKAEIRQQTAIDTGEALTWPDGRPRMQLVIEVQTDEANGDDDDGVRTLYAKGGNFEIASGDGTSMRDAIADAMKSVGAKSLDPGDEIWVGYTGVGKGRRGYNPPKLYSAKFRKGTPPSSSVKASDIFNDSPLETGV